MTEPEPPPTKRKPGRPPGRICKQRTIWVSDETWDALTETGNASRYISKLVGELLKGMVIMRPPSPPE